MQNHSTFAPSRATTGDTPSPTAAPAATVEQPHAPWVSLVKAGATRICRLLADALDDDACDRADSVLFLLERSNNAALWNTGPYVVALLRGAADTMRVSTPSKDVAVAVRPTAIALLDELASAVDTLHVSNDLTRLEGFSTWMQSVSAAQAVSAGADPAPSEEQADAFLAIARHASDIETFLVMSQDFHLQLRDDRRDAAVTAASGLAQLIGAISCMARGGQSATPVSIHAWLMRGAA
ncbi:MAG: hypothetical protein QM777_08755 [Pseudorhodoferax sp.]